MKAARILLAEDSVQDIELTLNALAEHAMGNFVAVARDGAEALDYLYRRGKYAAREDGDPVLMLLDLKMPKVDGLEVLRTVKSDPRLRVIPVVVLTSSREEQDVVRSYELGVNAYVVKPVEYDKFLRAVRDLGLFWMLDNEPPPAARS
jgi:CheY-like chemotaxis protein